MKILSTVVAYQGWLKLLVATVRTPDGPGGSRQVRREFVVAGDAAAVLAYDPGRRVALVVEQFRAPVVHMGGPEALLEAIAGRLDGDDPETCARREALEEAGVRLTVLEPVAHVWASPGALADRATLFLAPYALGDRTGAGGGASGEDEHITVLEIPLRTLWDRAQAGQILDLSTFAMILALKSRRPELFAT